MLTEAEANELREGLRDEDERRTGRSAAWDRVYAVLGGSWKRARTLLAYHDENARLRLENERLRKTIREALHLCERRQWGADVLSQVRDALAREDGAG